MSLRVVSGDFRGRVLKSVPGLATRPLLTKVRAALFDVLGPGAAEGKLVWDLFAGTGANGIEALSRGAREVTFVERAPKPLGILRDNLRSLGDSAQERAQIRRGDAWRAPGEGPVDLIFLDPPYPQTRAKPLEAARRAEALAGHLSPGGALLFHFEDGDVGAEEFPGEFGGSVEIRRWGTTAVAFLRR